MVDKGVGRGACGGGHACRAGKLKAGGEELRGRTDDLLSFPHSGQRGEGVEWGGAGLVLRVPQGHLVSDPPYSHRRGHPGVEASLLAGCGLDADLLLRPAPLVLSFPEPAWSDRRSVLGGGDQPVHGLQVPLCLQHGNQVVTELGYGGSARWGDPNTGECEFEEMRRTLRTEITEGDVIHAEVLCPGEDVRIRVTSGDQLTQDNTKAKNVGLVIVVLAMETLW